MHTINDEHILRAHRQTHRYALIIYKNMSVQTINNKRMYVHTDRHYSCVCTDRHYLYLDTHTKPDIVFVCTQTEIVF
jgi:hypothetical protein